MIPLQLNKQLHSLLSKNGLMGQKAALVQGFTKGRTEHSSEMLQYEAIEMVQYLKGLQPANQTKKPAAKITNAQKANRMRRKIIAMAHAMGWSLEHPMSKELVADMQRINGWCVQYGYLHKALNSYTLEELPKLITQFETIYKSFLKAI